MSDVEAEGQPHASRGPRVLSACTAYSDPCQDGAAASVQQQWGSPDTTPAG